MSEDNLHQEKLLMQRYLLKEVIGQGAMGIVYRAEDTLYKRQNVAVKILSRSLDDMKMIQRFQREATISALLSERSENIVKVSDYGVDENKVPFYVMEYLNGENLSEIINIHDISLTQFFEFARQICRAMETAHNGIFFEGEISPVIHRDIKPSNVFVIEDIDGKQHIKVLDFGIAKLVKNEVGEEENFMGTPRYCSPEQLQGKNLDNRSDIYSLGMIMYLMLSKKYPWDLEMDSVAQWYKAHTQLPPNKFPSALNIDVDLEKLILKCLEKSSNYRPQSVGEIIQKLELISRKVINKNNQNNSSLNRAILTIDRFLLENTWPKNKPHQKIVFPRIISYKKENIATICTMLEEEDIKKRQNDIHYNQFLFQSYPHPMILWLTVLYNPEDGARWLPCYLDLKTNVGQQVVNTLSDAKEYFLLFFALEKPQKCQDFLSFKVTLKQKTNLKQWASVSTMIKVKHNEEVIVTRKKLKQNLEDLKPKIILEIEKSNTQQLNF